MHADEQLAENTADYNREISRPAILPVKTRDACSLAVAAEEIFALETIRDLFQAVVFRLDALV
jgi:hypothetical protein